MNLRFNKFSVKYEHYTIVFALKIHVTIKHTHANKSGVVFCICYSKNKIKTQNQKKKTKKSATTCVFVKFTCIFRIEFGVNVVRNNDDKIYDVVYFCFFSMKKKTTPAQYILNICKYNCVCLEYFTLC